MSDWASLFSRRTLGIRLGLSVVRGVFEALGRPCGDVAAVHLVGTNGKGSTAAMVAHALTAHGERVGRYTSPHLVSVTERVAVDGAPVAEADLWDAVQAVDVAEAAVPGERRLSFFEVLTLAALVELSRHGVTRLVVEAGLGGRLDATRVVSADVVAVTSIALDHQQWLGDTLTAIAGEKAAVFAPGVPVVSAQQVPEVEVVLREQAERVGAPLTFVAPLPRAPASLPGMHQRENAAVALAVLGLLHPDAGVDAAVLDDVRWPGRLERIGNVILDVAHNPAGCEAIADALHGRVDRIFVASHDDKDRAGMEAALSRLGVPLTWVELAGAHVVQQVMEAAADARVLVCGSHQLVGCIRAHLLSPGAVLQPGDPRR